MQHKLYSKIGAAVATAFSAAYVTLNQSLERTKYKPVEWNNFWDKNTSSKVPHPDVRSCTKLLVLVRHGQYNTKAEASDKKVLTNLGWEQARLVGRRLRQLGYSIDCIVHSDMIRARQTTAGILSELDQVQIADTGILQLTNVNRDAKPSGLRPSPLHSSRLLLLESPLMAEGSPPVDPVPESEGRRKKYQSLNSTDQLEYLKSQKRIDDSFTSLVHRVPITPEGMMALQGPFNCKNCLADETLSDYCPCKRSLKGENIEVILLVGHANVFRYWLCRALQIPPEAWLRISLPHGSVSELLIEQYSSPENISNPNTMTNCCVSVLRIGDDGHLPLELQSR